MLYLLHFLTPYHHAQHYLGFVESDAGLAHRVAQHAAGQGARLMEVVSGAGIEFVVARTWPGDRNEERRLKKQGGRGRLCPICRAARESARATKGVEMQDGEMSVREAGRLGGQKRKSMLGAEGYSELGKQGGAATKARHGLEHYSEIGRKGGEAVLAKHGAEHFSKAGKKGGERMSELVRKGRAAEQVEA